ncbi:hypothetical protein MHU86_20478 [Fragilaria crotonensis]|nr:hypothetical protein MHU86_20478 [Fragilaria crotonensis]
MMRSTKVLCLFAFVLFGVTFGMAANCRAVEAIDRVQTSIWDDPIPRGGGLLPGGWNPFGYKITELGEQYLGFHGSLDSDVGRFLASLKTRKSAATLKAQWVEIIKVSKQGQSMRIYRMFQELLQFCLAADLSTRIMIIYWYPKSSGVDF